LSVFLACSKASKTDVGLAVTGAVPDFDDDAEDTIVA
jgi:hypothetical protein